MSERPDLHLIPSGGTVPKRPAIDAGYLSEVQNTVMLLTHDDWAADRWSVQLPATGAFAVITFPATQETIDQDILRITAAKYITACGSVDTAQRVVRAGVYYIQHLAKYHLCLEGSSTAVVQGYVDHLEHMSISDAVRNDRIRAACALFETCVESGLVRGPKIVDFSYRFREAPSVRRAPDQCVVEALDRIIFNMSEEIPLVMRAAYMLMRLIPNRISEVLGTAVDCIKYPDLQLYAISIPTSKETSLHVPICYDYVFYMDGQVERILYNVLRMQQESVGGIEAAEGYLLFDPGSNKLLSTSHFNQFLAGLIDKRHIRNADGSRPLVTSHMLRHQAIGERLRNNFSVEQTMKEANHSDPDITLLYGYMSEHDEAKHLGEITEKVLASELAVTDVHESAPRMVNPKKYNRLQLDTPYVRILPYGLCCNTQCNPQYCDCIQCDQFEPDPLYLPYFIEADKIIRGRIKKFTKQGAKDSVIRFEEQQLEVVEAYIARMTEGRSAQVTDIATARRLMPSGTE